MFPVLVSTEKTQKTSTQKCKFNRGLGPAGSTPASMPASPALGTGLPNRFDTLKSTGYLSDIACVCVYIHVVRTSASG